MCGICGILEFDGARPNERVLDAMVDVMRYRGPDEQGVHVADGFGFGHARLSIVDLEQGQQPMASADGALVLTFNGEIFNHVELRKSLSRRGHQFRTHSDTEVILHAYAEYGVDCVKHFNGQWAFAIWDARERRLFVSRDRLGIRPFFYTRTRSAFVFASEIKSILAHPDVPAALDTVGLDQLFTLWVTVPPRTMFDGVAELPPGHSMTVANGHERIWRYWENDFPPPEPGLCDADYIDGLRELLEDATRLRLRADVPVGAYLSGGLDSSVIAGIIKRLDHSPMRTFSIAFGDAEFDESRYQREVSERLGTEHFEFHCTYDDIGEAFPRAVWHAEKPMLRTAPVPLFLLSRHVHEQDYKVVLTGEGADEVLGGYDIFKEAKIRRFWAAQPESARRALLLKRLYPYMRNVQELPEAYLKSFFCIDAKDCDDPLFSHLPRWRMTSQLKLFYSADLKAELNDADVYGDVRAALPDQYGSWDPFSQSQYLESTYLMPGYILSSQGDRVAMAHSVEARFPFLDHRLVEFAARIPPRLKMKVLDEKYVLKRAAEGLVPESIRARKKQPYRAPDARSFFADTNAPSRFDYVEEMLSRERIEAAGVFSAAAVSRLVRKARAGRTIGVRDNMALVGVLSTQILLDAFMGRATAQPGGTARAMKATTAQAS